MKTSDLIFVGIGGSVVALSRATGEQVWATPLKGDFVNVLLENDRLFATANGEIYCLELSTGAVRWHNPLKGFGTGLSSMATCGSAGGSPTALMAEKHNQDQQAAAAATIVATS